jgi:hypothetical protein
MTRALALGFAIVTLLYASEPSLFAGRAVFVGRDENHCRLDRDCGGSRWKERCFGRTTSHNRRIETKARRYKEFRETSTGKRLAATPFAPRPVLLLTQPRE